MDEVALTQQGDGQSLLAKYLYRDRLIGALAVNQPRSLASVMRKLVAR